MTKLVLKTIAITLIAVLGACFITFGSLALFAPKSLADFFDGLGMYKSSIIYYEKQYGKSEDIEDLAVLVLKIDDESDSEKAEKYLKVMIESSDFESYCQAENARSSGLKITLDEFYKGKYAVALVRNDKFDLAMDFANDCVSNGYKKNNPFSLIISEFGQSFTKEQLENLRTEISAYVDGENGNMASADISVINQLIDNK